MMTKNSTTQTMPSTRKRKYAILAFVVVAVIGVAWWYNSGANLLTARSTPAEPIKSVRQKIWAGYYRAEVNERYWNQSASFYDGVARASTIALAAVSILVLVTAGYMANAKPTKTVKLWILGIESAATIASVVIALWNFNAVADSHRAAANAWRELAVEWDKARDMRKTATDDELAKLQQELLVKQKKIEDTIEPTSYSRTDIKKAQDEYDKIIGIRS